MKNVLSTTGDNAIHKSFHYMTDDELRFAITKIITSSSSEEEIQNRARDELRYPYGICLCVHVPDDKIAQALFRLLDGPMMKNGAMVMAMFNGSSGNVISI